MGVAINNRTLWKLKKDFAKNVASISSDEIFGVGCSDISWDDLYKDYLIIELLECHTGEVLTQLDIECLSKKVTN